MGFRFFNNDGAQKTVSVSSVDLPSGTVMDFAGSAAPTGWTVCDGSAISRTTYSALFSVIGTTYGVGDGSTTFNVPDARGRVAVGPDTGAGRVSTNNTLAAASGLQNHTLAATESGVPLHSHPNTASAGNDNVDHAHSGTTGGISANHQHLVHWNANTNNSVGGGGNYASGIATAPGGSASNYSNTVSSDHSHNVTTGGRSAFHQHAITMTNANNTAAAAASAHNNMQPYLVLNKIIKT